MNLSITVDGIGQQLGGTEIDALVENVTTAAATAKQQAEADTAAAIESTRPRPATKETGT